MNYCKCSHPRLNTDCRSAHFMVPEKGQLPREFARHTNGANSPPPPTPQTSGVKRHVGGTQDWGVLHSNLIRVQLGGNQPSLQHMVTDAESEHAECISPIKGNFLLGGNTWISCTACWKESLKVTWPKLLISDQVPLAFSVPLTICIHLLKAAGRTCVCLHTYCLGKQTAQ